MVFISNKRKTKSRIILILFSFLNIVNSTILRDFAAQSGVNWSVAHTPAGGSLERWHSRSHLGPPN